MPRDFVGRKTKPAFTLVELLVVIAIIGVLVALLLPAVQAAREASRRADCLNKLHQLGLAMHNYESARKSLPRGIMGYDASDTNIQSWTPNPSSPGGAVPAPPGSVEIPFVVYLLPYLEESPLYAQYDFKADAQEQYDKGTSPNSPVGKLLTSYQCPSDEPQNAKACNNQADDWKGNYGLNWGAYVVLCQRPQAGALNELGDTQSDCPAPRALLRVAPFHIEFGAKLAQITDGTSNTLAMMEMIQVESTTACDRRARIWCEKPGCYTVMTRNTPNSKNRDEGNCRPDLPEFPCADMGTGQARTRSHNASRSRHPGGVNTLMCDASVHFVSDGIDLDTWRAMSTMAGDDVFQPPW